MLRFATSTSRAGGGSGRSRGSLTASSVRVGAAGTRALGAAGGGSSESKTDRSSGTSGLVSGIVRLTIIK